MHIKQFQKLYTEHNPKGTFFDKATLKNLGETIDDMGIFTGDCIHTDKSTGKTTLCYGIRHVNRNHPKGEKILYTYFNQKTFEIMAESQF